MVCHVLFSNKYSTRYSSLKLVVYHLHMDFIAISSAGNGRFGAFIHVIPYVENCVGTITSRGAEIGWGGIPCDMIIPHVMALCDHKPLW